MEILVPVLTIWPGASAKINDRRLTLCNGAICLLCTPFCCHVVTRKAHRLWSGWIP